MTPVDIHVRWTTKENLAYSMVRDVDPSAPDQRNFLKLRVTTTLNELAKVRTPTVRSPEPTDAGSTCRVATDSPRTQAAETLGIDDGG